MIKKAINKATQTEYKVKINTRVVSADHAARVEMMKRICDEYVANASKLNLSETDVARYKSYKLTRKECCIFHVEAMKRFFNKEISCALYTVTKNAAVQTSNHTYDLTKLSVKADERDEFDAIMSRLNVATEVKTTSRKRTAKKLEASAAIALIEASDASETQALATTASE